MNRRQYYKPNGNLYHNRSSSPCRNTHEIYSPGLSHGSYLKTYYNNNKNSSPKINLNSARNYDNKYSITDHYSNQQVLKKPSFETRDSRMIVPSENTYSLNRNEPAKNYRFFWDASLVPFSQAGAEMWTAYQEEIQDFLNLKYKAYIQGLSTSAVNLIQPLENYVIDFNTNIEYLITNNSRKRRIKIEEYDRVGELGKSLLLLIKDV